MQGFVRRYRESIQNKTITSIKNTVKENLYYEGIAVDKYFFFGVEFDENGEVILGCGKCDPLHQNKKNGIKCSSSSHLNLMMTSIELMNSVENEGVFHIDGTHGIVKNKYPIDIFGVSDQHGTLHPIAFMITSFETVFDFSLFYSSLISLAKKLKLDLDPEYIMQDACDASYNAATKLFPNSIILMCFFHLQQNVNI